MARPLDFEKLAEKIYSELSPAATVTWDDHIPGKGSSSHGKIDVSIRRKSALVTT